MKKCLIISLFLFFLVYPGTVALSQTVVGDSVIVLTLEEAKTLAKITEDLKYTREELRLGDSISSKKDTIINLKNREINIIQATEKEKAKKIGVISGGIGLVFGIIIGILL